MSITYFPRILANAPTAYYRLGEASGLNAADSASTNTGTYSGTGVTYSVPGAIAGDSNTAVTFDGLSGKMTLPLGVNPASGAPFSLECWAKFTANPTGNQSILANYNGTTGTTLAGAGINIVSTGAALFNITNSSHVNVSIASAALSLNVWHLLVGTWDGATMKLYVDGSLVGSTALATSLAGTSALIVGSSPFGDFFAGSVDEAVVYPQALTGAQVANDYNAGYFTPPVTKIAGSAVFVQAGTLSVDLAIGRRGTAAFTVKQPDTSTHYQQYQLVQLFDQHGVLIFGGYINQPKEMKPGFQSFLLNQMTCMDYRWITDKRVIYDSLLAPSPTLAPSTTLAPGGSSTTKTYVNRPYDVIVQDIFNKYLAPEGVTLGAIFTGPFPSPTLAPSTTLAPNGPTQSISQVIFTYPTVTQALDALAASASASGVTFYWAIDQNKQFWFVPYTYTVNTTVVDGTQVDEGQRSGVTPYVTRANPLNRNTQYIAGGSTPGAPRAEYFTGNGQARTWQLSYNVAGQPTIIVNGTSKSIGIQGTSGNAYTYQIGSNSITQDSSQAVLVSTDMLEVAYTPALPHTASAQNSSAITAQKALDGTTGIVESVLKDPTISSDADGVTEANYLLNVYCVPGTLLFVFATRVSGYFPGQQITVTYAPLGFSSTKMLIESVHIDDRADGFNIWYTITAIIGPYDATWASFFGKMLAPKGTATAGSISVGI
jgi:concanavalin A-like lectin/glucanase superfamily protein